MKLRRAALWSEALRPFFLLAAAHAVVLPMVWAGLLFGIWPILPAQPVSWHAHEMTFGFIGAGLAGFLLTATPVWTNTAKVQGRRLQRLVGVWLLARLLGPVQSEALLALAMVANLTFLGLLLAWLAGPLLGERGRPHHAFAFVLAALWLIEVAYFCALFGWSPVVPAAWLGLAVGLFSVLIILAVSRISMQIVNEVLVAKASTERYLARPPGRNLAMVCVALAAVGELFWPGETISGWLALAAAAAVLNLLNDWHIRGVFADPYVVTLYLVYWLMAAGHAVAGVQRLAGWLPAISSVHLLTAGAMGTAMIAVCTIAGQRHTGRGDLSRQAQVLLPLILVPLAAMVRATAGLWPGQAALWVGYGLSSVCWILAFLIYCKRFWPWLTNPSRIIHPAT